MDRAAQQKAEAKSNHPPASKGVKETFQAEEIVDNSEKHLTVQRFQTMIDNSPRMAAQRQVIQRSGYPAFSGGDPNGISEYKYASGETITFIAFTSCIGVVGRKGNVLTGVHLVIVGTGADAEKFSADDVPAVAALLSGSDEYAFVGCVETWGLDNNDGMNALFAAFGPDDSYPNGDGVYTVGYDSEGEEFIFTKA